MMPRHNKRGGAWLTVIWCAQLVVQRVGAVVMAPPRAHPPGMRRPVACRASTQVDTEQETQSSSAKVNRGPTEKAEVVDPAVVSTEWELDVFSRPVLVDGKKLWELLVVDATGTWRETVTLPASSVNSVKVREAVEEVIGRAPVKPSVIRFFRRQMVNMLTIALGAVAEGRSGLRITPSRNTHALFAWLDERGREVYPSMPGYDRSLAPQSIADRPAALAGAASRLPDGLRGEQYAFITLPVTELLPGGGVTPDNVGVGRLLDAQAVLRDPETGAAMDGLDGLQIPGVALLTRRAEPLAMSLAAIELTAVRADASSRQLVLDVGLDDSYLLARLDDAQRDEAAAFDKAKRKLNGLHFVVVQGPDDSEVAPAGFWLLRDITDLAL